MERLPKAPFILASKHQSFFDTVIWSQLIPNAAYVMKEELLTQPIFGWFIRRIDVVVRANGFEPYVATIALDRIVPRPAP